MSLPTDAPPTSTGAPQVGSRQSSVELPEGSPTVPTTTAAAQPQPQPQPPQSPQPPQTVISIVSVPVSSPGDGPTTPEDVLNSIGVGTAIGIMLVVVSALALLRREYRSWRADQMTDRERFKDEILREVTPKLDTAVHELTHNSGTSTKDKVDVTVRELSHVRKELSALSAAVAKLTDRHDFWSRNAMRADEERAKLAERVAGLEGQARNTELRRDERKVRWPFGRG